MVDMIQLVGDDVHWM